MGLLEGRRACRVGVGGVCPVAPGNVKCQRLLPAVLRDRAAQTASPFSRMVEGVIATLLSVGGTSLTTAVVEAVAVAPSASVSVTETG